jgi:CheY-like chemotaxis protein
LLAAEHPLTILLAEDNPINQLVARRMFERFGYTVDLAMNGYEAVRAVRDKAYDVVFMDVQMPELNGHQATQLIRDMLPEGLRPRIVALTANAMEGDRESCLRKGMDDYVSKPIRLADLERVLRDVPRRAAGNAGGDRRG